VKHTEEAVKANQYVLDTYGERLSVEERRGYERALNEAAAERLLLLDYISRGIAPVSLDVALPIVWVQMEILEVGAEGTPVNIAPGVWSFRPWHLRVFPKSLKPFIYERCTQLLELAQLTHRHLHRCQLRIPSADLHIQDSDLSEESWMALLHDKGVWELYIFLDPKRNYRVQVPPPAGIFCSLYVRKRSTVQI